MGTQEPILQEIPKLRIDIVFDDGTTADKFEKYFKSKKEVRTTELKKTKENRYQLTIIMEKEFAKLKVIPSIPKLIETESIILLAVTNLQKTMAM